MLKRKKRIVQFIHVVICYNCIFFNYHRMADFIISKVAGSHTLGVYTIAYELSNLPTTELVAPIIGRYYRLL